MARGRGYRTTQIKFSDRDNGAYTCTPTPLLIETPMRPTILIADDHRLYADALRSMLSPAYEIVGIATNGQELTELAVQFKPDLIVTDHSMPLLNGLRAVHALARMGLRSKFIVLTMHRDVSLAVEAFRSGASAFVLKTASRDEFTKALAVVQGGGCYLSVQFPCDLILCLRRPLAAQRSAICGKAPRSAMRRELAAKCAGDRQQRRLKSPAIPEQNRRG